MSKFYSAYIINNKFHSWNHTSFKQQVASELTNLFPIMVLPLLGIYLTILQILFQFHFDGPDLSEAAEQEDNDNDMNEWIALCSASNRKMLHFSVDLPSTVAESVPCWLYFLKNQPMVSSFPRCKHILLLSCFDKPVSDFCLCVQTFSNLVENYFD